MARAVFGMVHTKEHAELVIHQLKESGFKEETMSLLLPDTKGEYDLGHERHTKAPEGATAGVGTGGLLGGALGLLAGLGALAVPGVGPLIAAGPIMAALSGAAVGAAVGGVAGALVGMGIPEFEAKLYEGKIRSGNILLSVHAENLDEADRAKDILGLAGAHDIGIGSEVPLKAKGRLRRRVSET